MRKKQEITASDFPLPSTAKIEKQVLSELLINTNMIQEARGILQEVHFHDPGYSKVFAALCTMEECGETIDYYTLGEKVGMDYVTREFVMNQVETVATGSQVIKHCYVLREGYLKRLAYMTALRLLQQSSMPEAETAHILSIVDEFKQEIDDATKNEGTVSLCQAMGSLEEALIGNDFHITSGFPLLDDLTYGGFDAGQLVILAARPSVGKTAVALFMALQAAKTGKKAHIYSIEMTREELAKRYIFASGTITPYDISKGTIDWAEYNRISDGYKSSGIYINDRLNTVDGIVGEIIRQQRAERLDIAYVDYLQLIRDISQVTDGKAGFIGMVTSRFKELAKTLRIPIVLLSQLNRNSVMNGTKRPPQLADLRDSGAIEQDADIVLMLDPKTEVTRDYNTNLPGKEKSLLNMWIRKNRGGRRDVAVQLETNDTHTTYEQIALITE